MRIENEFDATEQNQKNAKCSSSTQGEKTPQGVKSTYPNQTDPERLKNTIEKLKPGFTRIPNNILMEIASGKLSKAEIKILMLIARFTISYDNRETAQISKTTFQRLLGVQGSSVLEAIESLVQKGLIRKIQGNHMEKNRLGLVYEAELFRQDEKVPQGVKSPQPPGVKLTDPPGEISTHPPGEKTPHYKESSLNDTSKRVLSIKSEKIEVGEKGLKEYLKGLSKKNRAHAEKRISELEKTHSKTALSEAFAHLLTHGTLGTRERCNFPLNYLATAMSAVLDASHTHTEHRAIGQQIDENLAIQKAAAEESKKDEAARWAKMGKLFDQAFKTVDDKRAFIKTVQVKYPKCDPSGLVLRNAAIQAWAASQSVALAT